MVVRHAHLRTKPLEERPKKAEGSIHNGVFYGSIEARIDYIARRIFGVFRKALPHLVVVEDYAFSKNQQGLSSIHELGGVVKHRLFLAEALWIPLSSMTNKAEATGNGHASKAEMLEAARRWWPECPGHDLADAFFLAAHGHRRLDAIEPV